MEIKMGDTESVNPEVCHERHQMVDFKFQQVDKEIDDIKTDVEDIRKDQKEYNQTLKNIYYALLVIAFSTIMTLAGVLIGRMVDFHIAL
jgi:hypothetical protein